MGKLDGKVTLVAGQLFTLHPERFAVPPGPARDSPPGWTSCPT